MGSLGLGGPGSGGFLALIIQVGRHGIWGAPDRAGADLFDDRVVILGSVDLGGSQSCGAFARLLILFIVVIERAEQTDAKPVIPVVVARHWQTGHWLAFFDGRRGPKFPNGFLGDRIQFVHRLRHWLSLCELLLGMFFEAWRLRHDHGSERTEVQTVQIVRVVDGTTGRKVNSEKLLCQRLGRRLAAGTWRIRLVHNL